MTAADKLAQRMRDIKQTLMQRRCFGVGDLAAWRTAAVQAEGDIEEALAAYEAEQAAAPKAEAVGRCCYGGAKPKSACASCAAWTPAPQPATSEREPLTEEKIDLIAAEGVRNAAGGIYATSVYEFARAIERAHGIGTQPKQEASK